MKKLPNSGRKKGTGNHFSVSKIRDVLANKGINPAEKIVDLIDFLEPSDQLKAWCFLAGYCEAKPVEAEPGSGNGSSELAERLKNVSDEDLQKAITYGGARDVSDT